MILPNDQQPTQSIIVAVYDIPTIFAFPEDLIFPELRRILGLEELNLDGENSSTTIKRKRDADAVGRPNNMLARLGINAHACRAYVNFCRTPPGETPEYEEDLKQFMNSTNPPKELRDRYEAARTAKENRNKDDEMDHKYRFWSHVSFTDSNFNFMTDTMKYFQSWKYDSEHSRTIPGKSQHFIPYTEQADIDALRARIRQQFLDRCHEEDYSRARACMRKKWLPFYGVQLLMENEE